MKLHCARVKAVDVPVLYYRAGHVHRERDGLGDLQDLAGVGDEGVAGPWCAASGIDAHLFGIRGVVRDLDASGYGDGGDDLRACWVEGPQVLDDVCKSEPVGLTDGQILAVGDSAGAE